MKIVKKLNFKICKLRKIGNEKNWFVVNIKKKKLIIIQFITSPNNLINIIYYINKLVHSILHYYMIVLNSINTKN